MRYLTFRIATLACASAALLTAQALPTGYNQGSEITLVGVVEQVIERIDDGTSDTRAVIISPIGGGRRYLVQLGPTNFVDESPVTPRRGDRIEVTGSLRGSKYMSTIIARDVEQQGSTVAMRGSVCPAPSQAQTQVQSRTLTIRDSAGQPLWPAGSEQFRAPVDANDERARIYANGMTVETAELDYTTRSREMDPTTYPTATVSDDGMATQSSVLPSRIGGPSAVGAAKQRAPLSWEQEGITPPYGIVGRRVVIEERGRADEDAPVAYNCQTETTISGRVRDLLDATGGTGIGTGTRMVLLTDDGRLINAHISPAGSVSREQLDRVRGQRVTVTGSRVEVDGKQMILVRQIEMNGQTLQFRDRAGAPLPPEQR